SGIVLNQLRTAGLYPRTEAPRLNQRGGQVPEGFLLELTAPNGSIFYTTNGADPRAPVQIEELSRATLVARADAKRVHVPPSANPLPPAWRDVEFPDSGWTAGAGGVGYDRDSTYLPHIQTDVRAAMENRNTTLLVRI